MRAIGAMADRMLSAIVPKTEAAACSPTKIIYKCYCENSRLNQYILYDKTCYLECNGHLSCGACYANGFCKGS